MPRLKTIIGVLILFTYLCPFVSCNNDADVSPAAVAINDTTSKADSTISTATKKAEQPQDKKNEFWTKILFPTDNSVSGLGEAFNFDDNETSRFLFVSFLLSIAIILPIKTHYKTGRILVVSVNLACIIAFMYFTAIVEKEVLLWGMWLLLALVSIQLFLEIKYKTEISTSSPDA